MSLHAFTMPMKYGLYYSDRSVISSAEICRPYQAVVRAFEGFQQGQHPLQPSKLAVKGSLKKGA